MNNDKIDASEQSRRVICPVYIFPQRAYRTSYRALERTFSDVTPRRSRIAIFLQKNVQLLTYIVRQARVTLSLSLSVVRLNVIRTRTANILQEVRRT